MSDPVEWQISVLFQTAFSTGYLPKETIRTHKKILLVFTATWYLGHGLQINQFLQVLSSPRNPFSHKVMWWLYLLLCQNSLANFTFFTPSFSAWVSCMAGLIYRPDQLDLLGSLEIMVVFSSMVDPRSHFVQRFTKNLFQSKYGWVIVTLWDGLSKGLTSQEVQEDTYHTRCSQCTWQMPGNDSTLNIYNYCRMDNVPEFGHWEILGEGEVWCRLLAVLLNPDCFDFVCPTFYIPFNCNCHYENFVTNICTHVGKTYMDWELLRR